MSTAILDYLKSAQEQPTLSSCSALELPDQITPLSLHWIRDEIFNNWRDWSGAEGLTNWIEKCRPWARSSSMTLEKIEIHKVWFTELHAQPHDNDLLACRFELTISVDIPTKFLLSAMKSRDDMGPLQPCKSSDEWCSSWSVQSIISVPITFTTEHHYDRATYPSLFTTLKIIPPPVGLLTEWLAPSYCPECGSDEIQGKFWVPLNTPLVKEDILDDPVGDEYWCGDCKSHFRITEVQ